MPFEAEIVGVDVLGYGYYVDPTRPETVFVIQSVLKYWLGVTKNAKAMMM